MFTGWSAMGRYICKLPVLSQSLECRRSRLDIFVACELIGAATAQIAVGGVATEVCLRGVRASKPGVN